MAGLLYDMPDILADRSGPAPALGGDADGDGTGAGPAGAGASRSGRRVEVLEPGPVALDLVEDLDRIVTPGALSSVDNLTDGALADLFDRLREFELGLSQTRRGLHDRIDALQDEIARRYRDGELNVDALLDPGS